MIGCGAAGIAAGRHLAAAGASFVILEARDRVGGRALTRTTPLGIPVDIGCGWLHSADQNPLTALARAHGFSVDERLPDWNRGPSRRDYRIAYGTLEERIHETASASDDRAAAELLDPAGRWNAAFNAISSFANGVELDRLSVRDNSRYRDSGLNWRVREGYGALIAHLARGLRVELATPVSVVDHNRRDIVLETPRGTLRAGAVIVTVPTPHVAAGRLRFDPALPGKAEAAAGLPLGVANKLFLAIGGDVEGLPSDHHVLGSTERVATGSYQLRPHRRPIVECYFGGRNAIALEEAGPDAMVDTALGELAVHFGEGFRARLQPLDHSAWVHDPWALGAYSYALPGHADDRADLAAPVDGRIFFAGEATSPHFFSTAHGAWQTGIAAAEQALARPRA